ncbi:hypothetical protein MED222_05860 [Vibrio sp. MED222]|nr:hypothetical protein MED222_05860 [Vibrio sp. MED222]
MLALERLIVLESSITLNTLFLIKSTL